MKALTNVNATAIVGVEYFSASVIDEFIASRHASENTNRTYKNALNQLIKFFAVNHVAMPSESDIDNFVNGLKKQKKSQATQRLYFTVCKGFFSFLARRGYYADVAADVKKPKFAKTQTHKKRGLTNEQAQKLLASVEGDSVLAKRNRAVLALCLTAGLRTVEVNRADCEDLTPDGIGGYIMKVQGKGRDSKDSEVRVAPTVASLIDDYLSVRDEVITETATKANGEVDEVTPLFTSENHQNKGVRLSTQSIQKMMKKHMQLAGVYVKHVVSPHSTRHYCALQSLRCGGDYREIQAMLRHSSFNTTLIYLNDLAVENRKTELAVADSLFGGAA